MSSRFVRVFASVTVAGLAMLVAVCGAAPAGAAAGGRVDRALLTRCVKAVLGLGGAATPVVGSADPTVVSSVGVFRRARSAPDVLPAAADLRGYLAAAGASTYDPSLSVRLTRTGASAAVYGVPATISLPALPDRCGDLPQFAGVGAYLAAQADETGSGPGVCLISTQLVQSSPPDLSLPGLPVPKPTETLTVAGAACESDAVLSGYVGTLANDRLGSPRELALIPDGVIAVTYTLADGRQFTVPVAGNLVTPPAALSIPGSALPVSATQLAQQLAAHLPVRVTETGAGAYAIASLTRPGSMIADAVGSVSFLRGLYTSSSSTSSSSVGTSGSSVGTSGTGAWCSARTHRCVAVTVTTTCGSDERCRMSRKIYRYRYLTARPPEGTTGPDTQPTAPIVGSTNRFITRPGRLTLVLSGAPHQQVTVMWSVACYARNSAASGVGPPLQVAVPSRTPIELPGPARTFNGCDVDALVISSQPGPVHVTVASG